MKSFIAVLAFCLLSTFAHSATDGLDAADILFRIGDGLQKADKVGSPIYPLIKKIKTQSQQYIRFALPVSMVDKDVLESIQKSTDLYNSTALQLPSAISSKGAVRRIAMKGKSGYPSGTEAEMRQLEKIEASQERTLAKFKGERDRLGQKIDVYDREVESLQIISERMSKLVGDKGFTIIALISGHAWALSVLDFTQTLQPAVENRRDAAKAAQARIDKLIGALEKDLEAYKQNMAIIKELFAPPGTLPMSAPASGAAQLEEARRLDEVISSTVKRAREDAEKLLQQAAEISKRRANEEALSGLLSLTSAALGLADAVSTPSESSGGAGAKASGQSAGKGGVSSKANRSKVEPAQRPIGIKLQRKIWVLDPSRWSDQGLEINKGRTL